jgi:hypothetical protein
MRFLFSLLAHAKYHGEYASALQLRRHGHHASMKRRVCRRRVCRRRVRRHRVRRCRVCRRRVRRRRVAAIISRTGPHAIRGGGCGRTWQDDRTPSCAQGSAARQVGQVTSPFCHLSSFLVRQVGQVTAGHVHDVCCMLSQDHVTNIRPPFMGAGSTGGTRAWMRSACYLAGSSAPATCNLCATWQGQSAGCDLAGSSAPDRDLCTLRSARPRGVLDARTAVCCMHAARRSVQSRVRAGTGYGSAEQGQCSILQSRVSMLHCSIGSAYGRLSVCPQCACHALPWRRARRALSFLPSLGLPRL